MKDLIDFIARTLADDPEQVEVTSSDGGSQLLLRLAPEDVGKLIGRRGRTAKAMRVLIDAGGGRCRLDIDEHGSDEASAE